MATRARRSSSSRTSRRSGASCARRSARRAIASSSRRRAGAARSTPARTSPTSPSSTSALPDIDGIEVIRRIREWSPMPIIVLSARAQERSKIEALDAGADDYVTKPFGVGELLARVRVALRHAARPRSARPGPALGPVTVDLEKRRARRDGTEIHLTPIEFRLLAAWREALGMVVTHRQLLTRGLGADARERHALPAHLHEAAARQARARSGAAAPSADRDRRRLSIARRRVTIAIRQVGPRP